MIVALQFIYSSIFNLMASSSPRIYKGVWASPYMLRWYLPIALLAKAFKFFLNQLFNFSVHLKLDSNSTVSLSVWWVTSLQVIKKSYFQFVILEKETRNYGKGSFKQASALLLTLKS